MKKNLLRKELKNIIISDRTTPNKDSNPSNEENKLDLANSFLDNDDCNYDCQNTSEFNNNINDFNTDTINTKQK